MQNELQYNGTQSPFIYGSLELLAVETELVRHFNFNETIDVIAVNRGEKLQFNV